MSFYIMTRPVKQSENQTIKKSLHKRTKGCIYRPPNIIFTDELLLIGGPDIRKKRSLEIKERSFRDKHMEVYRTIITTNIRESV